MARVTRTRPGATRRLTAGLVAGLLTAATISGCTDDSGGGGDGGSESGLDAARGTLEETSGVEMTMSTKRLPEGTDGFRSIEGTLTDGPAFDGTVAITNNDIDEDLPMRVVDGAVYSQLPYTDVYVEVDPASYAVFEVAELMDPELGLAGWLGATESSEEDGDTVTGTLPGKAVAQLVETADPKGEFQVEWRLEDDRLDSATVTGPFYKGAKPVSYTLEIEQYDVNEDIRRPDTGS